MDTEGSSSYANPLQSLASMLQGMGAASLQPPSHAPPPPPSHSAPSASTGGVIIDEFDGGDEGDDTGQGGQGEQEEDARAVARWRAHMMANETVMFDVARDDDDGDER
jgi:hypothetical protein